MNENYLLEQSLKKALKIGVPYELAILWGIFQNAQRMIVLAKCTSMIGK